MRGLKTITGMLILSALPGLLFAATEFKIKKSEVDSDITILENIDKWLLNIEGATKRSNEFSSTYSFDIPYSEKISRDGSYFYAYNDEFKDAKSSFYSICKKLKGDKVTAVKDGAYYITYKDRYDASLTNKPFFDACEWNESVFLMDIEFKRHRSKFGLNIVDIVRYNRIEDKKQHDLEVERQKQKKEQIAKQKAEKEKQRSEAIRLTEKRISQAPEFRQNLSIGDMTTFGMVIDINRPIAKIQTKDSNEKWFKIDQLLPEIVN